MPRSLAAILLVAAMCFTGTNVPLGKVIVAEIPVYALLVIRFTIATAVLAILAIGEPGPRLHAMTGRQRLDVLLLALLGSVGYMALFLEGVRRTSGVDAGIILATLPALAALAGVALKGERLGRAQALAVALAVAGLVAVNTASAKSGGTSSSALGNALVGAAVLCEVSFVLVSRRISTVYRPYRLALAVSAAGLALSLPLGLGEIMALPAAQIGWGIWGATIWFSLSASVFSTVLWYRGAPHVETWLAGLATAALPVSALAVSVLVLGETMDAARLGGAALVIAAIVLGALAPRRAGRDRD